jgi:hypothetical protein
MYEQSFIYARNSVVVVGECESAHLREKKRAVNISSEEGGGTE